MTTQRLRGYYAATVQRLRSDYVVTAFRVAAAPYRTAPYRPAPYRTEPSTLRVLVARGHDGNHDK